MKSFFDKLRYRLQNYEHSVEGNTFDSIAKSLDEIKNSPSKPKWNWGAFKTILIFAGSLLSVAMLYSIYHFTNQPEFSGASKNEWVNTAGNNIENVEANAPTKNQAVGLYHNIKATETHKYGFEEVENSNSGNNHHFVEKQEYTSKNLTKADNSQDSANYHGNQKLFHSGGNLVTSQNNQAIHLQEISFQKKKTIHNTVASTKNQPLNKSEEESTKTGQYPKLKNTKKDGINTRPINENLSLPNKEKKASNLNTENSGGKANSSNGIPLLTENKLDQKSSANNHLNEGEQGSAIAENDTRHSKSGLKDNYVKSGMGEGEIVKHNTDLNNKEDKVTAKQNSGISNDNGGSNQQDFFQSSLLSCYEMDKVGSLSPALIENFSKLALFNQFMSLQRSMTDDTNKKKGGSIGSGKDYFRLNRLAFSLEAGPAFMATKINGADSITQGGLERKNRSTWQFAGYLHYALTDNLDVSSGAEYVNFATDLTYNYKTIMNLSDTVIKDTFIVVMDSLFQDSSVVITRDTVHFGDTTITFWDSTKNYHLVQTSKAQYLTIPINISYSYRINRVRLWVNAGIGLNFLVKGEEWVLIKGEDENRYFVNYPDRLKPFYLNLNLDLGTAYQLTEKLEVYVKLKSRFYGNNRYIAEGSSVKKETILGGTLGIKYQF